MKNENLKNWLISRVGLLSKEELFVLEQARKHFELNKTDDLTQKIFNSLSK